MKSKIFTFFLKIAFFIFGLMPRKLIKFFGCSLGTFLKLIGFKKARVIQNLNIVYGSKDNWPKNIISRIYRHFGLLLMEILKMPSFSVEQAKGLTRFEGLENLDKALEKNQGVILISGHMGNWECTMASLTSRGYDLSVVVKKVKNIDDEYMYYQLRGSKNIKTINKDKAVLNIRRALKKNGICLLVIDQNSKRSEGAFVEHFGKFASTYAAPFVLSRRFKCPVVPAFSYRGDNLIDHHAVIKPEIPVVECEDSEEELKLNLKEYLKPFEEFLLEHPDQWIWMHQRWRTQPK